MRLGLVPPVVNRNPRFDPADWEIEAGGEEIAAVARQAEELGYDFACFPHHVAIPREVAEVRGGVYWDQVATMAFVAARTDRIRLVAYCVVLGYRHPLEIAKAYGTIDRLSGGRLVLGVGVGSLRQEFELLGRPFEDRGARSDDAIRALRVSLSTATPSYAGQFYDYEGWILEPHAAQERVPIWVGGRSRRSLRRALELGDGWCPFGLTLEALRPLLDAHREDIAQRGEAFDVVLAPEPPVDPIGDPRAAERAVREYVDVGATALNLRFRHESLQQYLEQLEAMADVARRAGIT